jgi:hypothetical protein
MEMTEMEKKIVEGILKSEYFNSEYRSTWCFSAIEHSGIPEKQAREVIASLIKKNIVVVFDNEGKGRSEDMVVQMK